MSIWVNEFRRNVYTFYEPASNFLATIYGQPHFSNLFKNSYKLSDYGHK